MNVIEGYDSAEVLVVTDGHIDSDWILDSGCSFHMTPNRHWFQEFESLDGGKVLLGNHHECNVKGIGSIQVQMFNNQTSVIPKVRYVPELKRSLLSLGMFDKAGYVCKLENGTIKIIKGAMVKLRGKLANGLYILEGQTILGTATLTSLNEQQTTTLWHRTLGHVSERGLIELHKQGLLGSANLGSLDLCEHCVYGKSTRVSFSKGKHMTEAIMDYVHTDLWGPEKTKSLGGTRFFLSNVDDYSRRVWVYPLKSKDETFSKFKEWKVLTERKTNRKLKCLRTDNGLEFLNHQFKEMCCSEGIERHLTVKGTPQ